MTYSEFLVDITEPTMGVIRAGPWYNMVRSNYLNSDTCCHFQYLFPFDYYNYGFILQDSILETFKTYLRSLLCNLLLPLSCSLCLTLRTTLASLPTGQTSQTTNLESQHTRSLCGSMTRVKQTVVQHWSTIG